MSNTRYKAIGERFELKGLIYEVEEYKGWQLKAGKGSAYTRLKAQPACTEGELKFSNA